MLIVSYFFSRSVRLSIFVTVEMGNTRRFEFFFWASSPLLFSIFVSSLACLVTLVFGVYRELFCRRCVLENRLFPWSLAVLRLTTLKRKTPASVLSSPSGVDVSAGFTPGD